ncbi:MAG: LamG domain-containing protein [Fimbriimonadaceae bacterium]|nr:LamG domain-containing protein [Fimbriimonadaceae bacterium]
MTRFASLLLLTASLAVAAPQPTFTLDFENGFEARGPAGRWTATPEGQPALADGKFGKCLRSGAATGYLQFPTAGVVRPTAGTVEMWVCPVDWQGNEEFFHAFFDVRGEGALYLYKYYQGGLLMLSCPTVQGPYRSASASITAWKPGEWHHLAGTWSPSEQVVYVDGKRISGTQPALPKSLGATFTLGDHPWHIPRPTSSLIDNIRIYDRALSAEHIAAHATGNYDLTVPFTAQTANLSLSIDPATRQISVQVATTADQTAGASVEFGLQRGTQALLTPVTQALTDGVAQAVLTVPAVPPGDLQVQARLRGPAGEVGLLSRLLRTPDPAWFGHGSGREDRVLPPWTALQSSVDPAPQVSCWGRRYELGGDGLPTQITAAGEPLLAAPVRLVATVGGRPVTWQPGAVQFAKQTATRAEWTGSSRGGGIELRTSAWAEYDGLLELSLAVTPPPGLETLALELPLRPDRALYRHRWTQEWAGLAGALPAGDGVVDKAPFLPYAWLGDHDRGLFWFCESGRWWPNHLAANACETVRRGNQVVLRFNLLAKGQAPPPNWVYRCGLQATPVKAVPRDWRRHRMDPAPRANLHILWPTPQSDSLTYYGYPEARDPAKFAARVSALQAKGLRVIPYSCLSFFSGAAPEWPWFETAWKTGSGDSGSSDVAAYGAVFEMTNVTSSTYSDFLMARNQQFMRQYKLDGYYHDNSHPYAHTKEAAGCGWQDAGGAWHPDYPILAYRDLYRRLYAVAKTERPDAWLMAHMSGKVCIPMLAYEDAILDGEHFRGRVQDWYGELLPLDTLRAEYLGRQWGVAPYFLPEFNQQWSAVPEPTRGLLGLLLAHDIGVWPIWCHKAPVDELFDALDGFGYVDADFLPYFDAAPAARSDQAQVVASAYRVPGRALLVVANTTRESQTATITLDSAQLGVPLTRLVAWPGAAPLSAPGGKLTITVAGLSYQLVWVGPPR